MSFALLGAAEPGAEGSRRGGGGGGAPGLPDCGERSALTAIRVGEGRRAQGAEQQAGGERGVGRRADRAAAAAGVDTTQEEEEEEGVARTGGAPSRANAGRGRLGQEGPGQAAARAARGPGWPLRR